MEEDFIDAPQDEGNVGFFLTGGSQAGELEDVGDRDVFAVRMIGGLTYTIEMRGSQTGAGTLVDPHLFIVDFGNEVVVSDDDSGDGFDALITFVPPASDEYYLSAREFAENATGSYLVLVSAGRGTEGDDEIEGAVDQGDAVQALGGDDVVNGGLGDDFLDGGGGGDFLVGGVGSDRLLGRSGADVLIGGRDEDVLRGYGGIDNLRGGRDADVLIGGRGVDVFQFFSFRDSARREPDILSAGNGGDAFDGAGRGRGDLFDITFDADRTLDGVQEFAFGGASDRGKGFVWFENDRRTTLLCANLDDDARPEFVVRIEDGRDVRAADYGASDFFGVL